MTRMNFGKYQNQSRMIKAIREIPVHPGQHIKVSGPGVKIKTSPESEKDVRRVQLRANQRRDETTHTRPKPSMPRMPWDE